MRRGYKRFSDLLGPPPEVEVRQPNPNAMAKAEAKRERKRQKNMKLVNAGMQHVFINAITPGPDSNPGDIYQ